MDITSLTEQFFNLPKGTFARKLPVKHGPENEIIINPVWCDIGSHKAHEDEMRYMGEDGVAVCEGCYDHYN